MTLQLVALAVVLVAALVQLSLDHFWRERPESQRRHWARVLFWLIAVGALMNGVGMWLAHSSARDEQIRIERSAKAREMQAQRERQAISTQIQTLVTLAREHDPDLTEEEALRTITNEVLALRQRASQLEHDLSGLQRYTTVARYDVLGLTGIAGAGLKENSPIARALEGAYVKEGNKYFPRCDSQGISQFASVARDHPNFPFSYWALALCLRDAGDPQWRIHADRAISIFEHTTKIDGHNPQHDQAKRQLDALIAEQ